MALTSFLNVPLAILNTILLGVEEKDIETTGFKELVKSNIFAASSLPYIRSAISLPLIYVFTTSVMTILSGHDLAVWSAFWAQVGNLVATAVILMVAYAKSRKVLKFKFPWKDTARFLAASLIMTLSIQPFRPMKIREALEVTVLGAIVYFSILYLISKWFRVLASRTYRLLTRITSGKTS